MDVAAAGWEDGDMSAAAFPAAPFPGPTRLELEPVPLAVVRHEGVRIADLPSAFDAGYAALGSLFAEGRLVPTGPAIAVYHGDPMGLFDLELGFPVAEAPGAPIPVGGVAVEGSRLPAGPAYASTHEGSYDTLGAGWQTLVQEIDVTPTGIWIESYVSDPSDTAPDALRTDLIVLTRD